ncbi:MAG: phosphoenolpyruvate carboxylase [Burkholderiales bacterium]|jgi:phosphoenolpyruvate carboxylase|nr:phosphoenolpyruvate carboxylase [Burkholderiales bacterium]
MKDTKLHAFNSDVLLKYQIFSGLFLSLPFKDVDQSGARLSIFAKRCEDELAEGKNPLQIVENYLSRVNIAEDRKVGLLFKFLQFIERQVVLFDALEDAAFSRVNNLSGIGTVDYLLNHIKEADPQIEALFTQILNYYKIRITLTAHPTQFYPNRILGIIMQIGKAINSNDLSEIRNLFLQMGLTRFSNITKPTPMDEANSLIWYLEHVFYKNLAKIQAKLPGDNINIELGFWPGGDRDGNPYVTHDVTLSVARRLRKVILRLYYKELRELQERLTFDGVFEQMAFIIRKVGNDQYIEANDLITDLTEISKRLVDNYNGLFAQNVNDLIQKVRMFNFYFVKLDIRQNSHIHGLVVAQIFKQHNVCADYLSLPDNEKIKLIKANLSNIALLDMPPDAEMANEVLDTVKVIHKIQSINGSDAIPRYIISNTESVANIFEVLLFIRLYNTYLAQNNVSHLIQIEVVPLFETITDLENANIIMETLYQDPIYREHLLTYKDKQTIMLGFSDGTKDGGYLMANWAIYAAKKNLTALAHKYGINVVFFDGRGGPPARGGGNTNDFYRSLGQNIESKEIHLTIQGQTISSNFGTDDSATFNLEQLFTSAITGKLFPDKAQTMTNMEEELIRNLAKVAYDYYIELREDPLFVPYLEEITPLRFLAQANVGSRPAKRNSDGGLKFSDLRAIPFVGSWTQMKQNILGFYGLGHAIKMAIKADPFMEDKLRYLYNESLFFSALINNSMQSLAKSNFAITAYLADDKKYGSFWKKIQAEADNTREMLLLISGHETLLETESAKQESIKLREKIILPLLIIQQYAMMKLRDEKVDNKEIYEKLVKKSLAANINANRNSV